MKLRVKFAKVGPLKFVGYLDTLRFFQKAIRRAHIDVAYSQGYSPHQIMSFAAPLGVGIESVGEYFDMEVHSCTSSEAMKEQLNEVMPEGIWVESIRLLPDTIKNAMASIAAARYVVSLREGYSTPFVWQEFIDDFMAQDSIMVRKKTKKSEREIDVKPLIYDLKPHKNGLEMMVDASSAANIKPKLVMKALYEFMDAPLGEYDIEVMRMEVYGHSSENGSSEYQALEDFGNEFYEESNHNC